MNVLFLLVIMPLTAEQKDTYDFFKREKIVVKFIRPINGDLELPLPSKKGVRKIVLKGWTFKDNEFIWRNGKDHVHIRVTKNDIDCVIFVDGIVYSVQDLGGGLLLIVGRKDS